jgi:hypothetical protein
MIQDPDDGSQWFIGSVAEASIGAQVGAGLLVNVHPESACAGRHCVVHNPSNHHMRGWRLNWRDDVGVMERLCPHGIGHPDPDDLAYRRQVGRGNRVHGCDGCCRSS